MTYAWRTSHAVVDAIRERYIAGVAIKVIAIEVGVDEAMVTKYVRDLPSRVPALEAKVQEALRRVQAGECPRHVARELRVSPRRLMARLAT